MPVPDPRDPRPAYEQIADDLRTAIREGRLQPGDRLPTERQHAARYGVAVNTYRQALALLRDQGWLATHKRHGSVVLQPEQAPSPEYIELTRRLDLIESQVSQMADLVGQAEAAPQVGDAGLAARLALIETALVTMGDQVNQLAHHADRYEDLKQGLAQLQETLARLGSAARSGDADASLEAQDLPGPGRAG